MSAPRLLDKRILSTSLANERKQEIDKGMKLARSIDALRDERVKEEQGLEEFRRENIARVRSEIDRAIAERDLLIAEIPRLKEEKIRAQAPIDLKEAWKGVESDKAYVASLEQRLTTQSIEQLARENKIREDSALAEETLEKARQQHELAELTRIEADSFFLEAESTLEKANTRSEQLLEKARAEDERVQERTLEADERDKSLSYREEVWQQADSELSVRENALKIKHDAQNKSMASREANLLEASRDIERRLLEVQQKESSAHSQSQEAGLLLQKAKESTTKAEIERTKILADARKKESELATREEELTSFNVSLVRKEETLSEYGADLVSREKSLETRLSKHEKDAKRLSALESELIEIEGELTSRTRTVERNEQATEKNLEVSEERLAQAELLLSQAREESDKIHADAKQREAHISVREQDATTREARLSIRESEVENLLKDIQNREIKLRSRQETFMKAQAHINSKK